MNLNFFRFQAVMAFAGYVHIFINTHQVPEDVLLITTGVVVVVAVLVTVGG